MFDDVSTNTSDRVKRAHDLILLNSVSEPLRFEDDGNGCL